MSNKNRKLNVNNLKIFQEEPCGKNIVMGFFHIFRKLKPNTSVLAHLLFID